MKCWSVAAVAIIIALAPSTALRTSAQAAGPPPETTVNRGVVQLETARAAGISVRIAEDLASIIDDGATRRVLPVVGKGSLQDLTDLKLLRGIDMAILQLDVLDYARQQNLFPGIADWVTYISKLYNAEFHLLARKEITGVTDLANQKVNVDLRGTGTAITTARLFDLLKIPITMTNDDQEVALEKLRKGEIAALCLVSGKPAPIFGDLDGNAGFHFLAIPLDPAVTATYLPTRLTAADYPALVPSDQPVDTVAVGTMLAAAIFRRDLNAIAIWRISSRRSSPAFRRCWNPAIIRNGARSVLLRSFPVGGASRRPSNGSSAMCRSLPHLCRRISRQSFRASSTSARRPAAGCC